MSPRGDADVFQDACRWFGTIEVTDVPLPGVQVVEEMLRMLDTIRPSKLDRDKSAVRSQHDWHDIDGIEISLVHMTDPDASITIAVGSTSALLAWLTAHEHIWPEDALPERPWTTVVVDATAAILRGEYEVYDHYRGRRLVKTRVRDLEYQGRVVSTTGTLSALLPWPKARVVTRRIDFGAGT